MVAWGRGGGGVLTPNGHDPQLNNVLEVSTFLKGILDAPVEWTICQPSIGLINGNSNPPLLPALSLLTGNNSPCIGSHSQEYVGMGSLHGCTPLHMYHGTRMEAPL